MADLDLSGFDAAVKDEPKKLDLSGFDAAVAEPAELDLSGFDAAVEVPEVSTVESAARGAAQEVTFGFADEISGALESAFSSKTYRQARDESRQAFTKAEQDNPKTYLGGQLVGGVATTFVPGLGWLNAAKGARVAATAGKAAVAGAISGAGHAKELEDVAEGAAIGGAIGGAAGGALGSLGGLYKMIKTTKPSAPTARLLQEMEEDLIRGGMANGPARRAAVAGFLEADDASLKILRKAETLTDRSDFPGVGSALDDAQFRRRLSFAQDKTPSKKQAEQLLKGMNRDQQQEIWTRHQEGKAIHKAIAETNEEWADSALNSKDSLRLGFFQKWLDDPQFVARKYDKMFNLDMEGAIASAGEGMNRVQVDAAPLMKRIPVLQKSVNKAFPNKQAFANAMENPKASLSPEQQTVVDSWRSWYDEARGLLNDRGVKVDKLSGYFPMQRAEASDIYTPLKQKVMSAKNLMEDDDLVDTLRTLNGGVEPKNRAQAMKIVEDMMTPARIKQNLGKEASAAFERQGAIPEGMREYDASKVAINYLMGNLKAAHMRPAYDQLYTTSNALRALKATDAADYVDQYFSRMSGHPSDFFANMQYRADKWRVGVDSMFGDLEGAGAGKRGLHKFGRAAPDFVDWMTSTIYPNVMGWNIHAPVRNMTQTMMLTAPELGTGYGHKAVAKGWAGAAKALYKSGTPFKHAEEFLQSRGLMADQAVLESARKAVDNGISQVPGIGKAAKGIDKLGELGMTLYTKSDTANRFLTWHAAQEVAKDALTGNAKALKFLKTVPGGMRHKVEAAIRKGDQEALGDMLGRYLIRKTQFNYGKAGLSKFGQEYGRVASMFTKWPVMIGGDIVELSKSGRKADALAKYLAPFILMAGAHRTLDEMDAYDNPVMKGIIGSNVSKWSPTSAVTSFNAPPLIATPATILNSFGQAMQTGDFEASAKKAVSAITPFIPVVGAVEATRKRFFKEKK